MQNLHLIGNAHLDPVWLWRWPQGAAEIKATFLSALERMDETPGYIFTAGAISYYEWVMENEPELFARIEERVAEGRWIPVNGWWVQPDCNLPSGESFARHSLLGQTFLKKYLDHPSKVGYNVDSFGHNAGLPQILNQAGMKYYVMMRPGEHEKHLPHIFWWEGSDGSRVLTYRIIDAYCVGPDHDEIVRRIDKNKKAGEEQGLPMMLFYGVGNHGGGPTVSTLQWLTEMMEEDTSMLFSDPERYFAELEKLGDKIPTIKGDLQHHASGCYATNSPGKEANRKAEAELTDAEKMMSIAHETMGLKYHAEELNQGWKTLLFNQFHDIMGGCSIRAALEDSNEELGSVRTIAKRNLNRALQRIAFHIDTKGGRDAKVSKDFDFALWETEAGGAPLVVFNTLPWEVTAPVQLYGKVTRVEDDKGDFQPLQIVRAARTNGEDCWDSIFSATVPPMGYRVYRVSKRLEPVAVEPPRALGSGDGYIENEYFRITAANGGITEIFDKTLGRNILSAPVCGLVIDNTEPDTWAHNMFTFRDVKGAFEGGNVTVTETGPLRVSMRINAVYGTSKLMLNVSLTPGDKRIQLSTRLLWNEEYAICKLTVPVELTDVTAAWDQAYAVCEKEADGREVPTQRWGDVTGKLSDGTGYGLTLANNGRYSYEAMDGEIRLTLARSAAYADHYGQAQRDLFNECMDLGEHFVGVTLIPHCGSWQDADINKAAEELAHPLILLQETYHTGELPEKMSFAHIEGEGVEMGALKMAEDQDGYIVRLWETRGRKTQAKVVLDFIGNSFDVELAPYQIASYRVKKDGSATAVNLVEESL